MRKHLGTKGSGLDIMNCIEEPTYLTKEYTSEAEKSRGAPSNALNSCGWLARRRDNVPWPDPVAGVSIWERILLTAHLLLNQQYLRSILHYKALINNCRK